MVSTLNQRNKEIIMNECDELKEEIAKWKERFKVQRQLAFDILIDYEKQIEQTNRWKDAFENMKAFAIEQGLDIICYSNNINIPPKDKSDFRKFFP
jgi:hypothetical protein